MALLTAPAAGQLPSASTAALGMGDNFTAAARGLNSVAWNPAGLGLPGGGRSSLTLFTVRGGAGLDPVTFSDLTSFSDAVLPADVKDEWLARIEAQGGETGTGGVDATWAAFHIGRFAAHVASSSRVIGDVSPGVARLVMYGSVDAASQLQDLGAGGSSFRAYAYSSAGISYAQPLPAGERTQLSLGITVRHTWGHLLAAGEQSEGIVLMEPVQVELDFPVVYTRLEGDSMSLDSGRGFGADLGVALQHGVWTFAAVARNFVSSFAWDTDEMRYRPLSFSATSESAAMDTDPRPLAQAPEEVRSTVDELGFERGWAVGAAVTPSARLLVTADARYSGNRGIGNRASRHLGAGAQYRLLSWLPVRGGAALVSLGEDDSGHQLGAGVGIDVGGVNMSASVARRATSRFGAETSFMLTFLGTGLR